MIRYEYVANFSPPAPFVHVVFHNPKNNRTSAEIPAQINSGADRTVIPSIVAEELELISVRDVMVEGLGSAAQTLPEFVVSVQIRLLEPIAVSVLAHEKETYVLLGRDVLNKLRVV